MDKDEFVLSEHLEVPEWIEQDITLADVENIVQGGCASGAYMPAVTYYKARETMNTHGDAVLDYIHEQLGELRRPSQETSWSGIAVHFLSMAVELWASTVDGDWESYLEVAGS